MHVFSLGLQRVEGIDPLGPSPCVIHLVMLAGAAQRGADTRNHLNHPRVFGSEQRTSVSTVNLQSRLVVQDACSMLASAISDGETLGVLGRRQRSMPKI